MIKTEDQNILMFKIEKTVLIFHHILVLKCIIIIQEQESR